jgi:hypothetical protein
LRIAIFINYIFYLIHFQVISGPRNKGTVTRTVDFGRTPISDIFGGKLRYRVHREGDHCTDNIQPFFTLPLDIEVCINRALSPVQIY